MQFLCNIIANSLPIICQSTLFFYYIVHIVAIATNYCNLLYQCFTNHYQSDPVLYITSLPMVTNTSLSIMALVISCPLIFANDLPIINLPIINLPMVLGNLPIATNGLPSVRIGNDIGVTLFCQN